MSIRIYNSLTNRKETFEPVEPGKVGMYLCGPTVYKPSHIGHAVGPVIFDAIKRYLVFRGYEVTWVVNITDVEDKLIAEAEAKGTTVTELARQVTQNYFDAMAALNVTGIDHFPRASAYIGEIIAIIEKLIANNAAYETGGDVYFDVTADEDYGRLSNRSTDDQSGQRELQSGVKRHPGDFALWKSAKPEEPEDVKFDSPWGSGRPGWHIECSAMAMKLLGETFDIHGGGLDLIFPHHENEIAQSETCTHRLFAKYWMHHGLTRFNTKKVSKSDPAMQAALAQMTLSNLLQHYDGELLRYFILSTHYRRPIEYSPEEIAAKKKGLLAFYRLFERVEAIAGENPYGAAEDNAVHELSAEAEETRTRFTTAMDDDFNTAAAIAALFELANKINRYIEAGKLEAAPTPAGQASTLAASRTLIALGRLLGLFLEPPAAAGGDDDLLTKVMDAHLAVRASCREAKAYELADRIRDGLADAKIVVEDKPAGTTWSVGEQSNNLLDRLLQLHVDVRQAARAAKNFALADQVRDQLAIAGITLEDKPTGTTWQIES